MKQTLSREHRCILEITVAQARAQAESDLLMHPDGYPVSLNDCRREEAYRALLPQ